MGEYAVGSEVLNGWKIVRFINEGGFGCVFEVEKAGHGITAKSALKVISIPKSSSAVKTALSEGQDVASVAKYFNSIVDDFASEIELMSSLNHPGIVTYQDHDIIPHDDHIGWDVLLRMELLRPLTDRMVQGAMSTAEVVDLGIQMADVLAFCHAKNIVHRDVKPANIFIDASGRYKLGDFGVARTVENTVGSMSLKGTEDYMAPEVLKTRKYGPSVDVYALGIVLYQLLNGNRLPFLPLAPAPVGYQDREQAKARRLSGEPLPPLSNCDVQLFRIVSLASAANPLQRLTAAQLRDMLKQWKSSPMGKSAQSGSFGSGMQAGFASGSATVVQSFSGGNSYNPASIGGNSYNPASIGGNSYNPASIDGANSLNPASFGGNSYNPASIGGANSLNPATQRSMPNPAAAQSFSGGNTPNSASIGGGNSYNPALAAEEARKRAEWQWQQQQAQQQQAQLQQQQQAQQVKGKTATPAKSNSTDNVLKGLAIGGTILIIAALLYSDFLRASNSSVSYIGVGTIIELILLAMIYAPTLYCALVTIRRLVKPEPGEPPRSRAVLALLAGLVVAITCAVNVPIYLYRRPYFFEIESLALLDFFLVTSLTMWCLEGIWRMGSPNTGKRIMSTPLAVVLIVMGFLFIIVTGEPVSFGLFICIMFALMVAAIVKKIRVGKRNK